MSKRKSEVPIKTGFPSLINQHAGRSLATVLTGQGRSAVAVIGVRGPHAREAIEQGFSPRTPGPFSPGQVRYGQWCGPRDKVAETDTAAVIAEGVVLTPMAADEFEIHCHGGPAAAAKIIDDLSRCQVDAVDQAVWTASQTSLLIAEAQHALAPCVTTRTAAIALDQVRGALLQWCQGLLQRLASDGQGVSLEKLRREIETVAARGTLGTRLAKPFQVVLVGPPNVGKSSLVNAIVGYDRSITMDLPGTTRDVLHAETILDGLPIRLSDTAGMHTSEEAIEQQGIVLAKQAASSADLVIVVSDPHHRLDDWDTIAGPCLQVINKVDLIHDAAPVSGEVIRTIATSGHGVDELMQAIARVLGASIPAAGSPVPVTTRQVAWLRQAAEARSITELSDALQSLASNPR